MKNLALLVTDPHEAVNVILALLSVTNKCVVSNLENRADVKVLGLKKEKALEDV